MVCLDVVCGAISLTFQLCGRFSNRTVFFSRATCTKARWDVPGFVCVCVYWSRRRVLRRTCPRSRVAATTSASSSTICFCILLSICSLSHHTLKLSGRMKTGSRLPRGATRGLTRRGRMWPRRGRELQVICGTVRLMACGWVVDGYPASSSFQQGKTLPPRRCWRPPGELTGVKNKMLVVSSFRKIAVSLPFGGLQRLCSWRPYRFFLDVGHLDLDEILSCVSFFFVSSLNRTVITSWVAFTGI